MKVPGVTTKFFVPEIANHVPHMDIAWDAAKISLTPQEVSKLLRESKPSIVLTSGEERPGLSMNSFMRLIHEIDRASTKPPARHSRAVDSVQLIRELHHQIEF